MASLPSIASAPPYAASATSTEPRTSLSTFTTVRAIRASRPMETRAVVTYPGYALGPEHFTTRHEPVSRSETDDGRPADAW